MSIAINWQKQRRLLLTSIGACISLLLRFSIDTVKSKVQDDSSFRRRHNDTL